MQNVGRMIKVNRIINEIINISKKYYNEIILMLLIVFHSIVNYIWLMRDTAPPEWDDQDMYLITSIMIYRALETFSIDQLAIATSNIRPVLVPFLTAIFYFFAGVSQDIACMSNILYLAILLFSVYGISKKISHKKEIGLLSAFIVSTFPMIFGMSRQFLMDLPLTAFVSSSVYLLFLTSHFENRRYSLLLGVSMGLGMLTKQTFPIFLLFPLLFIMRSDIAAAKYLFHPMQFFNRIKQRRYIVLNILCAGIISFGMSSIWYIPNINNIYTLFSIAKDIDMNHSIMFYPLGVINFSISFLYFMILVFLTIYTFLRSLNKYQISNDEIVILIMWIVMPFLIFSIFIQAQEFRYLLPATPPIAIIMSLQVDNIKSNIYKLLIILFILLVGLTQFFSATYGISSMPVEISVNTMIEKPLDKWIIYSQDYKFHDPGFAEVSWTYPPRQEDWKIKEIIDLLYDISNTDETINLIPYCERFSLATFIYYELLYDKIIPNLVHLNSNEFRDKIHNTDYVIAKNRRNCDVDGLCNDINASLKILLDNSQNFTIVKSFSLPDGSEVEIYKTNRHTMKRIRPIGLGGWHGVEKWSGIETQWMQSNATLQVNSSEDRTITLSLQAQSFYHNRTLEVYRGDELLTKAAVPTNGLVEIEAPVHLVKGTNALRLRVPEGCERPSDIKELNSTDARCLSVAIQNIALGERKSGQLKYHTGFYDAENWFGTPTRWMQAKSTLLVNSSENRTATLNLNAASLYRNRTLEISSGGAPVAQVVVPARFINVSVPLQLAKGANTVQFHVREGCERPSEIKVLNSSDNRCLSVAVQNLIVT